ncbi:unnamed protein product [Thelazia callipaeda]|uniref:Chloride channel protein n=1 Tax=Thelazia callipaeda TaxID=103827 RepID=A0A0N5CW68_THECL|nr:unnamed protein product [Thelazia callipaeda]
MEKFNVFHDATTNLLMTYLAWMTYAMLLLMLATIIVHYLSISAIGSGIPEVKVILQGVNVEKHLTFRTLVSKLIGLMLAIGSGFPIGKEGPFVHMGSVVAHLMRRLVIGIKPAYANESRSNELLAAGCAAGVAATFSAPVGGSLEILLGQGVLFSIEVTTAYFAVRDYWRGFFAAACGAATFSLLRVWIHPFEVTVAALFQTKFRHQSYYPEELLIFALIGIICGLASAIFILIHRRYVLFLRRNNYMKQLFQRHWIVYPLTISMIYATITYPYGFGQYITGQTVFARSLLDFFANCTWHVSPLHAEACNEFLIARWKVHDSVFIELIIFVIGFYFLAIVASTLPVPAGIFMPAFVIGAAIGRLIGEFVALIYPHGFREDQQLLILPGIYSVVGAVSFCGGVTHTVSVSVIAFELTGQLLHILPVMIAVILANIVCSSLQPSFFESIIKIKHLPYFPDIPKLTSWAHEICVGQIMVKNVKFLTKQNTYYELQELLSSPQKLLAYPLVDNESSMILLGSVSRENLLQMLHRIVGDEARHAEYLRRIQSPNQLSEGAFDPPKFYMGCISSKVSYADQNKQSSQEAQPPPNESPNTESRRGSLLKTSLSDCDMRKSCRAESKKESSDEVTYNRLTKSYSGHDIRGTLGNMFEKISHTFRTWKRSEDLTGEERQIWEKQQLSKIIDYSETIIDSAPFQLVENTSLYKVHSIFSLLGIRRAYVTKYGVLIGVVAAKEIVTAFERMQAGTLTTTSRKPAGDEQERRSSEHGETGLLEDESSESESDNEDLILPRVEFDKSTASEILEAKFAAMRASSMSRFYCLSDRNRRKSYPNFVRKSREKPVSRSIERRNYDGMLKLRSSMDEQVVKQKLDEIIRNPQILKSDSPKQTTQFDIERGVTRIPCTGE